MSNLERKQRMEQAAEELLRRQDAKKSLLAFTEYTKLDWNTGEHHRVLCAELERVANGETRLLAVHAPRRHSKSELTPRRFPAWYVGKFPDRQLICASATARFADDIGADVRDIVDSPRFRNVFPGVELQKHAKAAGRWRTNHGGIYYATGVGAQTVGRGAHLAVIDDPHAGRLEADSERDREVVGNWYFGDLYPTLMKPRSLILIMTRWHEDDLAGQLMPPESEWSQVDDHGRIFQAGSWRVVKFKAIENEGTEYEKALWPGDGENGYPLEELQEIRSTMMRGGRARDWNAQYQQEPVIEDGDFIKREWFKTRYKMAPEHLRYYIACDFALGYASKRSPDWTEFGVFGIDVEDNLHVVDWYSSRATTDVWIDALVDLIAKYRPQTVFGEAGPIRRAVESILMKRMLERRVSAVIEWIPSIKDKAARGRSFQAWASMGRVRFPQDPSWADEVINQCVAFPAARHDDKFDVMSLVCGCIDQTQKAYRTNVVPLRPRDRWRAIDDQPMQRWKVI